MPSRSALPTYTPRPLGTWGKTWRVLAALFVGLLLFGVTLSDTNTVGEGFFVVDLVLGIVAIVLMPWRRRWPLAIALVVSAISAVSVFSVGALGIVVISVATRRLWREVLPVGAVWIGAACQARSPPSAASRPRVVTCPNLRPGRVALP